MEQQIRFCKTKDDVQIAYATVGEGPPLVKAANWLTHLEYDWESPIWRHWMRELADRHTLVRYDARGSGLWDWEAQTFSFDAWVMDLETVINTVALDRFALLGISQGGSVAIEYAIKYPERVSHLILYGAYAQGRYQRAFRPDEAEQHDALRTLAKIGWGSDNPAFRQLFSNLFMPEATPEQVQLFTELQKKTTSPENAVRFFEVTGQIDVLDKLKQVGVPTLVLHADGDARVPYEAGRQLAAGIPNARFVMLSSKNHILLENEPAWQRFKDEVLSFIGAQSLDQGSNAIPPAPAKPSAPVEPSQFGHYQIVSKLGAGGMGVVYKAYDPRLDRHVALKLISASLKPDVEARKRFEQEARVASALDHPNICTIFDVGETDEGQLYIVTAYYDGETLEQKIARGPMDIEESTSYTRQIAAGLAEAHAAGIVHRDIKPANLMVTQDGVVKLLDFGLAKVGDVTLTKTGITLGTLAYMSPEQIQGAAIGPQTDLWSLGIVLYEMLAGERPFSGEYEQAVMYSTLNEEPAPLQQLRKEVPQLLADIVHSLLQKSAIDRPLNAVEVIVSLQSE